MELKNGKHGYFGDIEVTRDGDWERLRDMATGIERHGDWDWEIQRLREIEIVGDGRDREKSSWYPHNWIRFYQW